MRAPIPSNEQERLRALEDCRLLDTAAEDAYDRITRIAAQLFAAPIATVSLVAGDRQFFKSSVGLGTRETSIDAAFCAHTILGEGPLVVLDARLDPRFSDNPLVVGKPGIRFYCGVPLTTPSGYRIGTVCVIDTEPRSAPAEHLINLLRELAAQASTEVGHHLESLRLAMTTSQLSERERELERERQLRLASEIRAELALEAGNMGVWEWDTVRRQAIFSPVMQRFLGYTGEAISGDYHWLERIHPEDRRAIGELVRSGVDKPDVFSSEFRAIPVAGAVRWLAIKGRYRRDGGGRIVGANGVCWDVTERRKADEELRASEEVFRGISAASPVGIFQSDLRGNTRYTNPRMREIWGMTEVEMAGRGWVRRLHPENVRALPDGWLRANAEGRPYEYELRLVFPDGSMRWIQARSSILRDGNGIPVGTVGTVDDITERKRLEEERHASQELTRRILESSADCINVLDLEGRLLSMSPRGQRALGIEAVEPFLGSDYCSWWTEAKDREAAQRAFKEAAGGGCGSFQGYFPGASGELRWWDTAFNPIMDQTGKPERILCVSRDLSELRRAAEEQETAREVAEEANRAKSLFLANVSHELRTPLNGVLGMTELLLGSGLTEEQADLANTVKQSGGALLALVDDLLDLTRVEAGKLECKRVPFDLAGAVNQAVALVAAGAKEKGLELSIVFPPELPKLLLGDEDRIRQIVLNYLQNALKFTDGGGIRVEVRIENRGKEKAEFLIVVRDTGKGIPEEAQANLFTPFRQADDSSTRKHGGLGLGLAISKRIAEIMGGSVGLTSAPGQGSTFWVRLPLDVFEQRATGKRAPEQLAAHSGRPGKTVRVLVAEDNAINRKLILKFLEKLGCVPDVAWDGAAAVRFFEKKTYDLVLMDCQMPELDGYQATERMRALEGIRKQERTPIIAVTAHAMTGDRERCYAAGMDDHLAKPLSLEALRNILAKWHGTLADWQVKTAAEAVSVR